jgi:hypothetical protein
VSVDDTRARIVTEYVDLCEQLAAIESVDEDAEQDLYARLDQLWYVEMTADEQHEAEDRLVAKARSWHDTRHVIREA